MGVLLAGGASRRFGGRPKGLATIDGARIADLVLGALGGATNEQLVIANDSRAHEWFPGSRVVHDLEPGLGPLAGIAAALDAAAGAPVIVVAWDMPFVTAGLLLALRRLGDGGACAVLPAYDGHVEPLCAYYAGPTLATCRTLLAAGERRAAALAGALPAVAHLMGDELARCGDPVRMFTSVDSAETLAALGGWMDA